MYIFSAVSPRVYLYHVFRVYTGGYLGCKKGV